MEKRDLKTDFELALNKELIPRLDEARAFTKKALQIYKKVYKFDLDIDQNLVFFGHSLGGFLAEGVFRDYPGSRCFTVQPGAPVIKRGNCRRACAFQQKPGGYGPIRFVRKGDVVSRGVRLLGYGWNIARRFIELPKEEESLLTIPFLDSVKHKIKSILHQHSLLHYAKWHNPENSKE
jgi:hypothetical protein